MFWQAIAASAIRIPILCRTERRQTNITVSVRLADLTLIESERIPPSNIPILSGITRRVIESDQHRPNMTGRVVVSDEAENLQWIYGILAVCLIGDHC